MKQKFFRFPQSWIFSFFIILLGNKAKQSQNKTKYFLCLWRMPYILFFFAHGKTFMQETKTQNPTYQDKLVVFAVSYLYAYEHLILAEVLPMYDLKRCPNSCLLFLNACTNISFITYLSFDSLEPHQRCQDF